MVQTETHRFQAGEATLEGTLVLPDGEGRHPWVLELASWLPRDRDGSWDRERHASWFAPRGDTHAPGLLGRLARALADAGVATFRYDKRGCGRSEGDWSRTSLFTLIDDARDALGSLRGDPRLDLRRTGIVGHGEGALIAVSVAIADPAVGALTLVGPAARSWRHTLRRGAAERSRTGVDREHPLVATLDRSADELIERADGLEREAVLRIGDESVAIDLAWTEQAIRTPPIALATMLHRSVALVHGELDSWAHREEAGLLSDALPERPSVRMVRRAGHDLQEADAAEIQGIASDLAARLIPRELPPVLLAIESRGTTG